VGRYPDVKLVKPILEDLLEGPKESSICNRVRAINEITNELILVSGLSVDPRSPDAARLERQSIELRQEVLPSLLEAVRFDLGTVITEKW
jgi:hypothetical protein